MPTRYHSKSSIILAIGGGLLLFLGARYGLAQAPGATTHTVFMTAMEIKGSTTSDKLAPPKVNPEDLSKGYEYAPPGKADKENPKKWQVSSYLFSPSFVTVHRGDTVVIKAFVVNGNEHDVSVTDPDGRVVVPPQVWNRGREYSLTFKAEKAGVYHLSCAKHAPTMAATFLVLPRK